MTMIITSLSLSPQSHAKQVAPFGHLSTPSIPLILCLPIHMDGLWMESFAYNLQRICDKHAVTDTDGNYKRDQSTVQQP